jgi:hypothetical protein
MKLIPATSVISHYKVAEKLLESGVTMVHLFRDRPGVVLPAVCNTAVVHLNFSYRYGIADFCVDEKGIRASLSFGGVPHFCDIPWTAVCGISSQVTDDFFIWIGNFSSQELSRFVTPDAIAEFQALTDEKILNDMPELKAFVKDDAKDDLGLTDEEDEEEEDDDMPEGGYTPLRFV